MLDDSARAALDKFFEKLCRCEKPDCPRCRRIAGQHDETKPVTPTLRGYTQVL